MTLVRKFELYVEQGDYARALPLIEEIVQRAPHLAMHWFNWGKCLAELERWDEAADKFVKAWELNANDPQALHWACLALILSKSLDRLLRVMQNGYERDADTMKRVIQDERVARILQLPEFKKLRAEYSAVPHTAARVDFRGWLS